MSEEEYAQWLQDAIAREQELNYRPDPDTDCCDDPECPHRAYSLSQIAALDAFVKLHTALRNLRDSAQAIWPEEGPDACRDPNCHFEEHMHDALTKTIAAARQTWASFARACQLTHLNLDPEIEQLAALIPPEDRNPSTMAWLEYEQWPGNNPPPSSR